MIDDGPKPAELKRHHFLGFWGFNVLEVLKAATYLHLDILLYCNFRKRKKKKVLIVFHHVILLS